MRILIATAAAATLLSACSGAPETTEVVNGTVFPGSAWAKAEPSVAGMDADLLRQAREVAGEGAGFVTRGGRLVFSWGDTRKLYDVKSTTKSFGAGALGLALRDEKLALDDLALDCHAQLGTPPTENAATGWLSSITLRHLATHTAGFAKPGGFEELLFEPGTRWLYSDGGPNWLAECITLTYERDLLRLMNERIFRPIGIGRRDLTWRENRYRPEKIDGVPRREFGSGIRASVDAMARYGNLWLRRGRWHDDQLLPSAFVDLASETDSAVSGLPVVHADQYKDASNHYGLLWWNNSDGAFPDVPRDAFWSWGLYESLIIVIPSLDLVVTRAGEGWTDAEGIDYEAIRPFLEKLVAAVKGDPDWELHAPYPASPLLGAVSWSPWKSVVRLGRGGDNWPLTWGDDDALYTAYGDGWGFEPRVPEKLSLGLVRVTGEPFDFAGTNLRAPSLEQTGHGPTGRKASGLLMVEGVLYLWARNAQNSQLAWSEDHGNSWTWADWKFTTSFGYPTFLNFGKNYAGARDDFVYVFSHDNDSAYEPSDRMVLARVPKGSILQRAAYEFLTGLDADGAPIWSEDISRRGAVFTNPGGCYRSGISFNSGLGRYIWSQTLPQGSPRFRGGFGVYDAPEPWGPWTTLYFAGEWDMGPGETQSFPPKWMSEDGREMHLVFSGDDAFSVRRLTLETQEPETTP